MDYYIWGLQLSGLGTLLTGINFVVTILKMRAPGMSLMKMPMFSWTSLCTSGLIVVTFPILTATLFLLSLDRYLGTHFFTNAVRRQRDDVHQPDLDLGPPGGVHPDPAAVRRVLGDRADVLGQARCSAIRRWSTPPSSIMILSYLVWLHHFFTMGSGADVNSFFALTTMMISIPTGVKIFNWLFTMYRGRVRFDVPMLWTMGFLFTFTIGGMTGVMLSVAPADFLLHNSLFLVAHFHNVIIGGVVFGVFAAINYWFPKAFGFRLDPFWGKVSFWFWQIGFWVAFGPLYVLGLMGVTRRLSHFTDPSLQKWFVIAAFGAFLILLGILSVHHADLRQHPPARGATPWATIPGMPHPGMVHVLAAAGLQLRVHPDRARA